MTENDLREAMAVFSFEISNYPEKWADLSDRHKGLCRDAVTPWMHLFAGSVSA